MSNALTLAQQNQADGTWQYWRTATLAIAEYAMDDTTAVVVCIERTTAYWLVRAGAARFAEGITRGDQAHADAFAQVEDALARLRAAGPIDSEWAPLTFRALEFVETRAKAAAR